MVIGHEKRGQAHPVSSLFFDGLSFTAAKATCPAVCLHHEKHIFKVLPMLEHRSR